MPLPKASASSDLDQAEIAARIARTAGELALLAGRARWPLLTYFLNMARVEAEARLALDATNASKTAAPRAAARPKRRTAAPRL